MRIDVNVLTLVLCWVAAFLAGYAMGMGKVADELARNARKRAEEIAARQDKVAARTLRQKKGD